MTDNNLTGDTTINNIQSPHGRTIFIADAHGDNGKSWTAVRARAREKAARVR